MISSNGDQREIHGITWTNTTSGQFRYTPDSFTVALDLNRFRSEFPGMDAVQLEIPPNWVTDRPTWRPVSASDQTLEWDVTPCDEPRTCLPSITLVGFDGSLPFVHETQVLPVVMHGVSQFDPSRDAIMTPNSVSGWGVVEPDRAVFDRTFDLAVLKDRFFEGLYRAIVFLGNETNAYQGGICTGMARVALEKSLGESHAEPDLSEILLWHGRQLSDRALLAASRWLFVPSPGRAFAAFRRELIQDGTVRRCFDLGVPKPWRSDIFAALQSQGHTVVPFAFTQESDEQATVSVYDPNDPDGSVREEREIVFDLTHDTYAYPGLASTDDNRTTIIAVEQSAYRNGRTAILASVASLVSDGWSAVSIRLRTRLGRSRDRVRAGRVPLG